MVTSVGAMGMAIAKARNSGTAFVTVRNSGHFGGAGYAPTWQPSRICSAWV